LSRRLASPRFSLPTLPPLLFRKERWIAGLIRISIPLILISYSLIATNVRVQMAGMTDHALFVVLFFILYSHILEIRLFTGRILLSFFFILSLCLFFLFILLNFRFFQTWGQMDALKQWEDIFAIWTGIMALMRPADIVVALLLPVLLWQFSLAFRSRLARPTRRPLLLLTLFLWLAHFKLTEGRNRYSENNPFFYVVRQKIFQLKLTHGGLWTPRKGPRRWKNTDFLQINKSLYAEPRDPNYPFLKRPLPQAAPLPFALRSKPNVVLILMESVRSFESGSYGAAASMTPQFDRLAREGVLLKNFYANGAQTIRGEFAIHSSYVPNVRGGPVYIDHPDLSVKTLPLVLKEEGYSTHWIGSHPPTFDKKIKFLSQHGIDKFHYDVTAKGKKLGWGAPDEDLFQYAFEILSKETQPFFAEIMTLSNHFPFGQYPTDAQAPPVTGQPLYEKYCRGMYYTDHAVGRFLEMVRRSPLAENTLFIVTSDHGIWIFPDDPQASSMIVRNEIFFRVPCLFWAPSLLKPAAIDVVSSHVDITPSILDLLDIRTENAFLGSSVFRLDVPRRFALMTHDARWNLRMEDEYAYDVGPEAFLDHYPVGTGVEYLQTDDLHHLFFRSSTDIFLTLGRRHAQALPPQRSAELESFAEEAITVFDQVLLTDHIYPSFFMEAK
jgi:phosphoglycerol transferase MdoB-like AlkP superfamily enzyme